MNRSLVGLIAMLVVAIATVQAGAEHACSSGSQAHILSYLAPDARVWFCRSFGVDLFE
ncbi:MAG: hypothetical protein AB1704_22230 [Pseudomonadota bacterium]|jgi:hypothetical protein|uniref:hypothetical protein n=1 Tax=Burkholderiaceae TaxID=119060 RepID=UPI0014855D69|nr:hypothetical protein [Burkholderia sp. 4M9327F10]